MDDEKITIEMSRYEAQMAVTALKRSARIADKKTEQEGGSPKDERRRDVAEKLAERINDEKQSPRHR